ncbi:hypothetical protein PR048_016060 [Dryococelus australis]|uniref:SCP domain-containing protein n=1 Tax=Dryococelus australis TaxID=614101 RepID=A0ABQ9HIP3_9NEOP|nr:hypothetical protein PR048_016060 [Dryococelus australis]
MEKRRNARVGETEDLRENLSTSSIVLHEYYIRKCGCGLAGMGQACLQLTSDPSVGEAQPHTQVSHERGSTATPRKDCVLGGHLLAHLKVSRRQCALKRKVCLRATSPSTTNCVVCKHRLKRSLPRATPVHRQPQCTTVALVAFVQAFFAIKMWYLEKFNFTYGSPYNELEVVGHYTQMVWSATHRVGCGFTKCQRGGIRGKPFFNYVCNYCPIGNYRDRLGRPYKKGKPCSKCSGHCRQQKLCTNSCPTADMWANCRELNSTWHSWLCNDHTASGRERHGFCKATCGCRDKIF